MEHKLNQVEAERAMVIIEDTIEKLEFLGSITPDVLAHREELSQLVGDEISKIIQEQRALEKRYEELLVLRSELKGLANKSKYKEVQADLMGLSKALKESTRKLAKSLRVSRRCWRCAGRRGPQAAMPVPRKTPMLAKTCERYPRSGSCCWNCCQRPSLSCRKAALTVY